MQIAEIDVFDDDQLHGYWDAAREADTYERPYAAFWPLEVATAAMRSENPTTEPHPLAARSGDETVGAMQVSLPRLDNLHVAMMHPLVRPSHRGQGIGTALLEAGIALAREHGRTTVMAEVNCPIGPDGPAESADTRFAERHGFASASVALHRVLELPVADGELDQLAAGARPHHDEYEFVQFGDAVPDEHMTGYCALQAAFNSEAPLGELDLEPEVWDEARVRAMEERFRTMGRHSRATAAIAPDGTMVGMTEMVTPDSQPDTGFQSGTLVLKDHRGHRLGLALKVANMRWFQRDFPACRQIHSWNAEENGPMVAINDLLGFRPVEYLMELQRKL